MAKCERTLRVRHVIFGMNAAITADFTDFATADQITREGEHRIAEIVEADLRCDASGFGRVGHLPGVRCARRQRLLAVNVLSGSDSGQRHFLVKRVGRRDVDHIDVSVLDQASPVAARPGETERPRRLRCKLVGTVGDRMENQLERKIEDALCRGEAEHMGLAHEAGADQADLELRLVTRH